MKTLSDVTTLISGGEESSLLTRFLSTRPTLKQTVLDQSWEEKENKQKLEQLKGNYPRVIKQHCRGNELSDTQKDNILMLLNDVLIKSELTSAENLQSMWTLKVEMTSKTC